MKFPDVSTIAAALRGANRDVDGETDVRLQVYPDGTWAVHSGDASYDVDHRGYWGASFLPGRECHFASRDVAADLIDQAREHAAQSEGDES